MTIRRGKTSRAGVVEDGIWYGSRDLRPLEEILSAGSAELAHVGRAARQNPEIEIPVAEAEAQAPLQPRSIRDFLAFLDHLRRSRSRAMVEIGPEWSEIPGFYFSNTAATHGPTEDVRIFPRSEMFDFELEVAAVIGTPATNVGVEGARHHIAGFMLFCDWSARDVQAHEMSLGLGPTKSKDGANSFGPLLVTTDEFAGYLDGGELSIGLRSWHNGQAVTEGNTTQMDWSFDELVSYASRGTTLLPGDVIGSGTVPTGCLYEEYATLPEGEFRGWLRAGDELLLDGSILGQIRCAMRPATMLHPLRTGF